MLSMALLALCFNALFDASRLSCVTDSRPRNSCLHPLLAASARYSSSIPA
jgi:hypothetical protein